MLNPPPWRQNSCYFGVREYFWTHRLLSEFVWLLEDYSVFRPNSPIYAPKPLTSIASIDIWFRPVPHTSAGIRRR